MSESRCFMIGFCVVLASCSSEEADINGGGEMNYAEVLDEFSLFKAQGPRVGKWDVEIVMPSNDGTQQTVQNGIACLKDIQVVSFGLSATGLVDDDRSFAEECKFSELVLRDGNYRILGTCEGGVSINYSGSFSAGDFEIEGEISIPEGVLPRQQEAATFHTSFKGTMVGSC